ncbi:MAG: penicillin-binding protein activator LpoB [bacterium]
MQLSTQRQTKQWILAISYFITLIFLGCSLKTHVKRTDVDKQIDLSGKWNDTDSQMVSEEMIKDCLDRPWILDYSSNNLGKKPIVIVGGVKNRSDEHINTQTFTKDLERNLLNSGRVKFISAKDERGELREEKTEQNAGHTSTETVKSLTEEIGADFMLQGTINTIKDEISGEYVMFYQINLELTNLENHEKVWIGEKKIKKVVKRSRFGF